MYIVVCSSHIEIDLFNKKYDYIFVGVINRGCLHMLCNEGRVET